MTRKLLTSLLMGLCCCSFATAQDLPNPGRFSQWLLHDPVDAVQNFKQDQLAIFTAYGLGIGIVSGMDEGNSLNMQQYSRSAYLSASNLAGEVGYVLPASAALFGLTLIGNNTRLQDAAFTSLQSVIYTNLIVNTSKFIFSRSRPYEQLGANNFNFFSTEGTSFPSGHTSTAFAFFTPWAMYYPGPLTYGLMIIPVSTAIARIAKGKHWLSDVTAGGLVGFYWGRYLSRKHLLITSNKMEVTPFFVDNGVGVNLHLRF